MEPTETYRENFRKETIPKNYSGWLHLCINALALLTPIIYGLLQITDARLEWLIFPLTIIFGNFTVFWLHKYPLHRPTKWLPYAYNVHTKNHHRFFTHDHFLFESTRDWYILFFPPIVVLGFALIFLPLGFFAVKELINKEAAHIFVISSATYFLLYEVLHFISHLREDNFLLKFRPFKFMWNHHRIHHNPKVMGKYNFNIVYPLADYIFKTIYKAKD